MTRTGFDIALGELHDELLRMGSIVEKQIHLCIEALVNQDEEMAVQIIANDDLVDDLQKDIEDKCIRLIGKEQPLATDLRVLFTTSKIVTDLERMADHAVDIAKIVRRIKKEKYINELINIQKMADKIKDMIKEALDAYVECDAKKAYAVSKKDDEVDIIYKIVFNQLIAEMIKDNSTVNQAAQLLFVCKYLERIGDHVTNICEWTIYQVTGEYKDLNE